MHRNTDEINRHGFKMFLPLLAVGAVLGFSALLPGCASTPAASAEKTSTSGGAAASRVASAPSAPQPPARFGAAPGFYAGMSDRLSIFLKDLQQKVESGDWAWIEDHTERSYYRTLITNLHMKTNEYLRYLFRIGMDYKGKLPVPATPDQFFPATQTWDLQYVTSHSDGFVTTVYGYLYDRAHHKLDFAVDALDRIDPILLSGAYP